MTKTIKNLLILVVALVLMVSLTGCGFASKAENIQMFFTDFFQIEDVYNRPGTSGDANWSLRIPDNFKELTPIDLPEILKQAIISRGSEFAKQNEKLIEELSEV